MILAIARLPEAEETRERAAVVLEMPLADWRRKVAGTLPRVLLPGIDAAVAAEKISALVALGCVCLAVEPAAIPSDADRTVARTIHFTPEGLSVVDALGGTHRLPTTAIATLQRGQRVRRTTSKSTTTERHLSLGRAVLTGGLVLTKKESRTTVKTHEESEAFLVVERSDGEPDLVLYERRLDYRPTLGADLQPSSRANIEALWGRLRALVPPAAVDLRVSQPGFVSSLTATAGDPVDLALFLVTLARARGT